MVEINRKLEAMQAETAVILIQTALNTFTQFEQSLEDIQIPLDEGDNFVKQLRASNRRLTTQLLFPYIPSNVTAISFEDGTTVERPAEKIMFVKSAERYTWSLQELDDWAAKQAGKYGIEYERFFPEEDKGAL